MNKNRLGTRFWTCVGLVLFLIGGLVSLMNKPEGNLLTVGIAQIYYAVLVLCWMRSVRQRVVQRHIRRFIMVGAGMMLLFLMAQEAKYYIFPKGSDVSRFLWYLYYIPMTVLPLMLLYTAFGIGRMEERLPLGQNVLGIPALLLSVGILTNDLHGWAFRFLYGWTRFENFEYTRQWLYYVVAAWIVCTVLTALFIILKKCRIPENRDRIAIPVMWGMTCAAYLLWTNTIRFSVGTNPYEIGEVFCFLFVAVWESCIQSSLIPANANYGSFFGISTVRAQIADAGGTVRYAAENAVKLTDAERRASMEKPVMLDPDTRLCAQPVCGGWAFWTEDISAVNRANRQLTEVRDQLSEYNTLLTAEADAAARRIRAAEKNSIYDGVAEAVKPQLDRVNVILKGLEEGTGTGDRLLEACILTAFIKRRANLSLTEQKEGLLSAYELEASVRESAEYLMLSGVRCDFRRTCEGCISAKQAIAAYEMFEAVTEAVLPGLDAMLIVLTVKDGNILLRLTMDGRELFVPAERIREGQSRVPCDLRAENEEGTLFVTLRMDGEVRT